MLDIAFAYNRYKFLGHEFLTWLWFVTDNDHHMLKKIDPEAVSLDIGNRIVLENRRKDHVESITIKGDHAGLEEGMLALKNGALVSELKLSYKSGGQDWAFTVKGESLNISGLKTPRTGPVEKPEDVEGAVLEKAYLYEKAVFLLENLYNVFIKIRLSDRWKKKELPRMKKWAASWKQ